MSTWALAISLGPVQRFIAAGRRSRDLWWGSTWLSDLTWKLADHAESVGARGALPSKGRVSDIKRNRVQSVQFDRGYGGRVSNHLQLLVDAPDADGARQFAETLRRRAGELLAEIVGESFNDGVRELGSADLRRALIDEAAWTEQRDALKAGDFLELYVAWARVLGDPADPIRVRAAFKDADEHLQDVKNNRVFEAPTWTRPGRHKSYLDPGRDSVLRHDPTGPMAQQERQARVILGISEGEQLDALGLARRVASLGPASPRCEALPVMPFPSVSRVAADPWLRGLGRDRLGDLRAALVAAKRAQKGDFSAWCSLVSDPDKTLEATPSLDQLLVRHDLPFDASFLLDDGITAANTQLARLPGGLRVPDGVVRAVRDLHEGAGAPEPYYAILAMDGDGVGDALMREVNQDALLLMVKQLDDYADGLISESQAQGLRAHHGRAFYAGGDDLLGYLPLDHLLGALLDIDALFTQKLGARPGLSVSAGVIITHVKDDLREARQAAQRALDEAKRARRDSGRKIGFTRIVERPRSGVSRSVTGPTRQLTARLAGWMRALKAGQITLRTPELLDRTAALHNERMIADEHLPSLVLAKGRILQQIHRDEGETDPVLRDRVLGLSAWSEVRALADEMRISARLFKSWVQAGAIDASLELSPAGGDA